MSKLIDLSGKRFGRLVAISHLRVKIPSGQTRTKWICKCDCGNKTQIFQDNLRRIHTLSCGCLKLENHEMGKIHRTHGMFYSKEYGIWNMMIQRCNNTTSEQYKHYGARGIKVCDMWMEDFMNFYNDMGKKPSDNHSIDRRDGNGNYCPENCRWATREQQSRNISTNVWIEYNGLNMIATDWEKYFGVKSCLDKGKRKDRRFEDIYNFYLTKNNGVLPVPTFKLEETLKKY